MRKLIECVPNFSEGRDMDIIAQITNEIKAVEGVSLLDVDPGAATNRTVVTFVGEPKPVVEAAFRAIKKAGELIDMRQQKGEHPRFGATDVCPFVPVANATMDDCIECAKALGKRVGEELNIPVYLYENAASSKARQNLATVRAGEYEGIAEKIQKPEWKPDYGAAQFNPQTGNIAIGARDFLIAFNVNLNTTSVRRANSVAFDVREKGRILREGHPINGTIVTDENGEPKRQPGMCKAVKGIGWFIEEYGVAQISMNLTNVSITPLHEAFDACNTSAFNRGLRVTGSELVGLVPLQAMLDAGQYFLTKQERSVGVSESELIKIAVKSMGLDELTPFNPEEKIIEYKLKSANNKQLVDFTLKGFADETASESPAPGGGSVSAYVGALGVSLATMVANLSAHKRGWDDQWETFSNWADEGQKLKDRLLALVDEDTAAFNGIMESFKLPKSNDEEKAARSAAIQSATKNAILVPFNIMKVCLDSFKIIEAMAEIGNPNSVTDAGVGALCAKAAVIGAYLNVKVNAGDLKDQSFVEATLKEAQAIIASAEQKEKAVLAVVHQKLEA